MVDGRRPVYPRLSSGDLNSVFTSSPGLPPLLSAPVLAAILWAVCLALGYRALRVLKVSLAPFSVWERGAVCCAVGAGFLQYEPYLLAAFGKLSSRNVLLGFGLIFCLLIPDLLRVGRATVRTLRALHYRPLARAQQVWLVLFALFMGILLLRALTLSAFGSDDDGYHLASPRRWLADGTLSYLPSYTNTNASLGFEMLYMFGLASGSPGLKIIHFSAGAFSLLALWLCGKRLGNRQSATIAVSLILIATPICNMPVLFGLGYVDFGACWMTLTSVLVWLTWREQPGVSAGRLLLLMALVTGFAATFKSTALTVAFAWAPVLIWEARRRGLGWYRIFTAALGLGVIAFLPVTPWLFRNWHLTGNPVFPMFSSRIPTRDWPPEMARVFTEYVHYHSWSLATNLSESARKAVLAITAGLVLVSGGVVVVRVKDMAIRGLIVFSVCIVLMTLAVTGMIFRYWLAAEVCAVLVLATLLMRHFGTVAALPWLPTMLLFVALLVEPRSPGSSLAGDFRLATGMTTLDQEYVADPAWNMWRYINQHTAADARVLVGSFYTSFGASNYGCFWLTPRCFTTDSYIQSSIPLGDWQSFVRSLNQAGIHYLLISEKQFLRERIGFSFPAGDNEYPFVRRLADQYGKKLAQFGPLQFYSVDAIHETPST